MSVKLTRQDEFALITLDRQEALNALSAAVLRELAQTFDEVAASDARALIVTGAGAKAFCAGADIKELVGRSLSEQRRDAAFGQAVLARLENCPCFGRGHQRLRFRRRHGTCARLHLSRRRGHGENGPAGNQAWTDTGLRRHATLAARDRRSARPGHHHERAHARCRGGAAHRPGASHRRRRGVRRRSRSRANSAATACRRCAWRATPSNARTTCRCTKG